MLTQVIVLLCVGLLPVLLGYLINQLPPLRQVPGRTGYVVRMTIWVAALAIILTTLANDPDQSQSFLRIGVAIFATLLAYDLLQFGLAVRQAQIRQQTARDDSEIRHDFLRALGDEFEKRHQNTVHTEKLIDLTANKQPQRVGNPVPFPKDSPSASRFDRIWTFFPVSWIRGNQHQDSDPSFQQLIESVKQHEIPRLLVLGEPGAGKTTLMTQIALALLDQANTDETKPIPILLELSSWQNPHLSLLDWIRQELYDTYNIPVYLTDRWLEQRYLYLLLDGLDELGLERQNQVMERIDQYVRDISYPYIVVCCRRYNFEQSNQSLTALDNAIYLKDLSDEQIQQFLRSIDRAFLWNTIQQSADLKKLLPTYDPLPSDTSKSPDASKSSDASTRQLSGLRSPLLLTLLVIAYDPEHPQPIATEADLFAAYIEERFRHQRKKTPTLRYGKDKTLAYLTWLACHLEASSTTEFSLPDLSASWIETRPQRWLYRLIVGLIVGLIFGLIGGLIGGLIFGLIGGLIFGLIGGLIGGLIVGLQSREIQQHTQPDQAIRTSIKNTIFLGLLTSPFGIALFTLPTLAIGRTVDWSITPFYALSGGILFGVFAGGGTFLIDYFTLRGLFWVGGAMPRDYLEFLEYCVELRLLHRVGDRYRFIHDKLRDHIIGNSDDLPKHSVPESSWLSAILQLSLAILVLTILGSSLITSSSSISDSFSPVLQEQDVMLRDAWSHRIGGMNRGTVVGIREPDGERIMWVAGLPGETISIENQQIYVNGMPLETPYAVLADVEQLETPVELPDDTYYMIRNFYDDGVIQPTSYIVHRRDIASQWRWRIYPFDRMGVIEYTGEPTAPTLP